MHNLVASIEHITVTANETHRKLNSVNSVKLGAVAVLCSMQYNFYCYDVKRMTTFKNNLYLSE